MLKSLSDRLSLCVQTESSSVPRLPPPLSPLSLPPVSAGSLSSALQAGRWTVDRQTGRLSDTYSVDSGVSSVASVDSGQCWWVDWTGWSEDWLQYGREREVTICLC